MITQATQSTELQMELFTMGSSISKKFSDFHTQYPQVYILFERFAKQLIEKGHTKLGARMIIERIRWEVSLGDVKDADGFKINNMYIAHYSRMFIRNHPQYKDFFEFREIRTL